MTIQVFYLGVPVHTEKDDLCSKTSCPILPGEFALNNSEGLPDFTPTVRVSHWSQRTILKLIYLVIYIFGSNLHTMRISFPICESFGNFC